MKNKTFSFFKANSIAFATIKVVFPVDGADVNKTKLLNCSLHSPTKKKLGLQLKYDCSIKKYLRQKLGTCEKSSPSHTANV